MSKKTERLTAKAFEDGLSHEDQCDLLIQLVDALENDRDSLRAELHDLAERATELATENDRLYRLPTLEWARAKAAFLQQAANIARQGADAKPLVKTLDALGSYVTRLEAEADESRNQG